jgi:hypothetical protein
MAESPRRFPSPWRANKIVGGFVVRRGMAIVQLPELLRKNERQQS